MTILGIDEAGRGALIGPMIVAGVVVDGKGKKKLEKIGVKDSKQLSPSRRRQLSKEIEKIANHIIIMKVNPCKIDLENLNLIEMRKMVQIIEMTDPKIVYIDALTSRPDKFKKKLEKMLRLSKPRIFAKNHMDEFNPVVSAASIIAKVERDREIEKIKRKVGFDFGVGYPHDERAVSFVRNCILNGEVSPFIRWRWDTVKRLIEDLSNEGHKIKREFFEKAGMDISLQRKIKDFILGRLRI